ncbi:MAG: HU family DNA-binding protein [Planctomycetota bacterium]
MATVTKKDLIDRIADETGSKRTAVKQIVQAFLDEVTETLSAGDRLEFRDFGVFEVKERAAKMAQNPRTLEPVHVPAKRTVRFKPGRQMQRAVDASTPQPDAESMSAEIATEPKPAGAGASVHAGGGRSSRPLSPAVVAAGELD